MMSSICYHQMLVSPHVGGGAKIAMQIHNYVVENGDRLAGCYYLMETR